MTKDPGRTYEEPLEVEIYEGEVVITGPAGGFALTSEAAAQTAMRLAQAARQAAEAVAAGAL